MEAAKIGPDLRLFQANQKEGYRMVLRQTCVSENFGAISKSEKRFGWVSKSRVRVTFTSRNVKGVLATVLRVSELSFFLSFLWSSGVKFFRVYGYSQERIKGTEKASSIHTLLHRYFVSSYF